MMFYGMCGVQFPRLAFEVAESTVKHLLNKAKNMAGLDWLKAFMKQPGWPEMQDSLGQKLCDFRHIQKDKKGKKRFWNNRYLVSIKWVFQWSDSHHDQKS